MLTRSLSNKTGPTKIDPNLLFPDVDRNVLFAGVDRNALFAGVDRNVLFPDVDRNALFADVDRSLLFPGVDNCDLGSLRWLLPTMGRQLSGQTCRQPSLSQRNRLSGTCHEPH